MNEEQFILLAIKVLSGNAFPEDDAELQRQLQLYPAFRTVYDGLRTYWQADEGPAIDIDAALIRAWDKIDATPVVTLESGVASGITMQPGVTSVVTMAVAPARRRSVGLRRGLLAAAVMLPIFIAAAWLLLRHKETPIEWAEKYNPNGVRSMIILPDGTKIWLNADSRLEYPVAFGEYDREIRLTGEAFLDVARDPARPFIVRLPSGDVHVLGTSFDIRAYKDESETRTSVASGLVAFVSHNGGRSDSTCLHPNEKAVLNNSTHMLTVSATDAMADHNWINGVLVFTNQSLREIGKELERYFGKPVQFKNERVSKYRYTATFKNNSAEEILTTLKKVKSFHFKITDKYIEIDR